MARWATPPIHPTVVAGVLFYGMMMRVRSSRRLEYMCRHGIDFMWLAETPNAVIKEVLGLRQILTRGLEEVRAEWLWACTAYNLRKLIRAEGMLRAALGPATV